MSSTKFKDPLEEIEKFVGINKIVTKYPELYHPYRLIILNGLYRAKLLSFKHLMDLTQIKSDGNLFSHLRALEKQGLVEYHKMVVKKKSLAFYSITSEGMYRFEQVTDGLKLFVASVKK